MDNGFPLKLNKTLKGYILKLNRTIKGYILVTIFVCSALSSCQISGLTSGYSYLSKTEKERVINYTGKIDSISNYSYVYNITPEQIKEYLAAHKRVILYDYTPYCKSPNCVSPFYLVESCKAKDIDVLIISNIYDELFWHINKSFPLLMINTKECKTKWRWKYIDNFYLPLIGCKTKEVNYAGYHYFQDGKYIKSFKSYKDIDKFNPDAPFQLFNDLQQ